MASKPKYTKDTARGFVRPLRVVPDPLVSANSITGVTRAERDLMAASDAEFAAAEQMPAGSMAEVAAFLAHRGRRYPNRTSGDAR